MEAEGPGTLEHSKAVSLGPPIDRPLDEHDEEGIEHIDGLLALHLHEAAVETAAELDKEISRLNGMAAKKMKESNKKWLNQRLHILASMKSGAAGSDL